MKSCDLSCWGIICQWGGFGACSFFVGSCLSILLEYGGDMDVITLILRVFSIFFALCIATMSIDCLRNWAKGYMGFAWFLSHWTTRGFIMIYLGAVAASSYSINGDKVFCHEPTPSPPVTESESAASDSLDSLPPWVDVSRYLSGALLCGFGLLYMILGFFGADKDDNEEDQADTSKASGGGAPKEEMGPVAGTGSYAENRL